MFCRLKDIFYKVKRETLSVCLQNIRLHIKDVILICKIFFILLATIRCENRLFHKQTLKRDYGRDVCLPSFTSYTQKTFLTQVQEVPGSNICGRVINNSIGVDDEALLAERDQQLQG